MDDYPPDPHDQQVRLRHALAGPHRQLYNTSANFAHGIDTLCSWLPGWVAAMADAARKVDVAQAQALDLMKHTAPPTIILSPEAVAQLAGRDDVSDHITQAIAAAARRNFRANVVEAPYIDPGEELRLGAIHRGLRAASTQGGATAEQLAGGLPVDVAYRFLAYLEEKGWATSTQHFHGRPDGPRTWWARDNFTTHPYQGDWQGRDDTPCRHTVWGVRCAAPVGHDRHRHTPTCPDSGRCHHECTNSCWRVNHSGPLSGVYPGDRWPAEIVAANPERHVWTVDADGAACCPLDPDDPVHTGIGPHWFINDGATPICAVTGCDGNITDPRHGPLDVEGADGDV